MTFATVRLLLAVGMGGTAAGLFLLASIGAPADFLAIAGAMVLIPLVGWVGWIEVMGRRWAALAGELGLSHAAEATWKAPYPDLVGRRAGRAVRVHTWTERTGNSTQRLTAVEVDAPGAPQLRLTREGVVSTLAKAAGGQDVHVGNPDFDEAWRVQADDDAAARRALGFGAQAALLDLKRGEVRIGGGKATWTMQNLVTDPRELRAAIEALDAIAAAAGR